MINFKTWTLPEKNPAIPCKSLYLNIVNFKLFLFPGQRKTVPFGVAYHGTLKCMVRQN